MDHRAAFRERRQAGLGRDYLLHLQEDLTRLTHFTESGAHACPTGRFHRFLTRRFSAQVFYEIEGETIIVDAVFDCRENPEEIAAELTKR